jgi:hypothetical protein
MTTLQKTKEIDSLIANVEKKLSEIDKQRSTLQESLANLKKQKAVLKEQTTAYTSLSVQHFKVTNHSSENEKIKLFQSLFRGREDVFAKRFESSKTGKIGYQPCCRNEWVPGICRKPKTKCSDCRNRDFVPVDDNVIRGHLLGSEPQKQSSHDFTIGVYPMLKNETCKFLAVDFDKESWTKDAVAFMETCEKFSIHSALERSRSGQSGSSSQNPLRQCWLANSVPSLSRKLWRTVPRLV